jgi:hypothetical protein
MLTITCFVGKLRPGIELPFPLMLDGQSIEDYFRLGSMNDSGSPDINMIVDDSRFNASIIPNSEITDAVSLQYALRELTQNPTNVDHVNKIGLILADRYQPSGETLGLMFDVGFNPTGVTPVRPEFTAIPREGCAIFLNAIRDIRGTQDQYRREVLFTAIHELGHVFNLWHWEDPKTFMSKSQITQAYPSRAYFFHASQRRFLHQASTSYFVCPGGSKYETRGTLGPGPENFMAENKPNKELRLIININQQEFWYFEPIELDVEIRSSKNITIPNRVDPGYEDFKIYITKPDGTIFKYRSPRLYCQNLSEIKIDPKHPFRRDISIFGQSGGYTFSSPGIYKIECFLKISKNKIVRSNTIEFNVKERMDNNRNFLLLEKKITQKQTALLLYHRSGFYNNLAIEQLKEISDKEQRNFLGKNIDYALARYLAKNAQTKNLKKKLLPLIKKTLDSNKLSINRQKRLQLLLEEGF